MKARWSLRRRLVSGLIIYLVLLTLGVLANDIYVNERAEALVWESLLNAEMNHFLARRKADPQYRLPAMESLELFDIKPGNAANPQLAALPPGLHDEIEIDGREFVLLVRDTDEARFVLALDIADLEGNELQIRRTVFVSAFISAVLLSVLAAWGVARLTNPLRVLADQIRSLNPAQTDRRISLPANSSSELSVIVEAMNDFSERIERFIEREREFVNMASHELRTPLSIIDGAVSLTLQEPALPEPARNRMLRVSETIVDVNEMVALLLVLAKNPQRIPDMNENVILDRMLVDTINALQPLAQGKGLTIVPGPIAASAFAGPPAMVKSAITNLIRNAIEHSYSGQITVALQSPATVIITNPGQQTSAEEISRAYTRLARGGSRDGGGIGLALISRLCTHCGWELSIQNDTNAQIRMTLRFA